MKHLRFQAEKDHTFPSTLLPLLLITAVILAFAASIHILSSYTLSTGAESLHQTLEADISEFYARKGYYPESLKELTDTITIAYDKDDYFVDYQVSGANIRPSVTVLIRNEASS
jgi:competence protein ComGC